MKVKNSLFMVFSLVMIASLALASCTPTAAPTTAAPTAPAQAAPTTAPAVAPTAAPAQPTAEPVQPTTPPAASGPTKGGKIVVSDSADNYYTLDPFVTPWHDYSIYAMYDTMLTLKLDFSGYVGNLVTDQWEVSSDNLSVTFHVKPGVTFQDGTPVDAAAIKWNLEHWIDPKVAAPQGGNISSALDKVDAPDAATVVLHLKEPYAPLYNELSTLEMVSPTAYQQLGADKFAAAPVGAGPWMKPVIVANQSYTYSRVDGYQWAPAIFDNKGAVYPDQFEVKFVADDQTAFAALQTGEINVLANIPAQFLDQAKADPNIEIVKGTEIGGDYLGFNTQKAPFTDPQVRIAISYAIDRDELIQAGVGGAGAPMYSNLSTAEIGYNQDVEDYGKSKSGNVDTAKQMLADLGYKAGSDGVLVGKDGKPMKFTLEVRPTDEDKRIAEDLQAQLKDIGIDLTLDTKDPATIKKMTQQGNYDMILWYFGQVDPNIMTYQFDSSRIGVSNRTRYSNPDLDKLLHAADSAMVFADRMKAVTDVQKFLVDNRPNIPLFSHINNVGYRKDIVAGLKFDKSGQLNFMDASILKP